ncbi:MAG: M23 family metallopeptidase [Chitinophagaceae bacterium]|nr:MAG: M23 family metallopeptidase [Chitinophagaceae bacterium]
MTKTNDPIYKIVLNLNLIKSRLLTLKNIVVMKTLIASTTLLLMISTSALAQPAISIEPRPATVYIEQADQRQFVNCDFRIKNNNADSLQLTKLALTVYDKKGRMLLSRFLDDNGTAPSIQVIPNREFNDTAIKLIFNPFSEFSKEVALDRLVFEFSFSNKKRETLTIQTAVMPVVYQQRQTYLFPLKGRVLVYDGHDFYSHHRRFDYEFDFIRQLGLRSNFMRYAYDFILTDSTGKQFRGKENKDEAYFGFGAPVYAVAAGKVLYVAQQHKDDKQFDVPALLNNPLELYGNCIAIQHSNGAISLYGHLRQNSSKLKVGDQVKAGAQIGAIGVSGSSFLPHLHFEMRTSLTSTAEGLPSNFSNVYLTGVAIPAKLKAGLVETGNIIFAK